MASVYSMHKANKRKEGVSIGANVIPVYLKASKLFVTDEVARNKLRNATQEAVDRYTGELKLQGFDGAVFVHNSKEAEVVVFNPNQIRSIHAAFDPEYASSGNLLASQSPKYSTASPSEMAWGKLKTVTPGLINAAFNKGKKAVKSSMYGAVSLRQLTELGNSLFKGLTRDIQQAHDELDAMEQRIIHQASLIYKKGHDHLSQEQLKLLAELAHKASRHQVSADPEMVFEPLGDPGLDAFREELMQNLQNRFANELSPTGQETYRAIRDFYIEREDERYAALEKRVHDEIERGSISGKSMAALDMLWGADTKLKGDYFNFSRFGDYWLTYPTEDELDAMETFETKEEGEARIKELGLKEGEFGFGRNIDRLPNIEGVPAEFIEAVNSIVDATVGSKSGENAREEEVRQIQDAVYQQLLKSLPALSARKFRIHRKNVLGHSDDIMRAFAYKAVRDARHNARLKHAHKMRRLIDDAKKSIKLAESPKRMDAALLDREALQQFISDPMNADEIRLQIDLTTGSERKRYQKMLKLAMDYEEFGTMAPLEERLRITEQQIGIGEHIMSGKDGDFDKAESMAHELDMFYSAMMEPNSSPITELVSNLGFLWFLGASPAAALVNGFQTLAVSLPYLAGKFGEGKTTKELLAAYKDFFKGDPNAYGEHSIESNLKTDEEKEAFKAFFDQGLLSKTLQHDMMGAGERGIVEATGLRQVYAQVVGGMFQYAERLNREVTSMAAYRMARQEMGQQEAIQYAIDATYKTHGDYGATNRARFMRGNIMRVVTQFKQYSQMVTFLYYRTAFQALSKNSNLSEAEKKIAKKQLRYMLLAQTVFAGTSGLPLGIAGYSLLAMALEAMMGDDDEPFDLDAYLRKASTDTIGDLPTRLLSKGISGIYGMPDLHSRLSQSDLFIRDADLEAEGKDQHTKLLNLIVGPVGGGVLGNWWTAKEIASSPYDWSTWRGVEKAVPKVVGDVMKGYRYSQEGATTLRGQVIEDTAFIEELAKALGFSPSELNDRYQQNNVLMNLQGDLQERRTYLIQKAAIARRKRDNRALKDIWNNEIKPFNQHWRGQGKIPIKMSEVIRSAKGMASSAKRTENGIILNKRYQPFLEQYDYLS